MSDETKLTCEQVHDLLKRLLPRRTWSVFAFTPDAQTDWVLESAGLVTLLVGPEDAIVDEFGPRYKHTGTADSITHAVQRVVNAALAEVGTLVAPHPMPGAPPDHEPLSDPEYILCAAIWVNDGVVHRAQPHNIPTGLVYGGWRHDNCFWSVLAHYKDRGALPTESEMARQVDRPVSRNMGFLTSHGRYVDREQAAAIAVVAGQVREGVTWLMSEHLY